MNAPIPIKLRATTPPMTPPTIAPVSLEWLELEPEPEAPALPVELVEWDDNVDSGRPEIRIRYNIR